MATTIRSRLPTAQRNDHSFDRFPLDRVVFVPVTSVEFVRGAASDDAYVVLRIPRQKSACHK
jgi:hypothetical protein